MPRTAAAVASCFLACGAAILFWAFGYGIYDDSSMGSIFFLWGLVCALLVLVLPSLAVLAYLVATRRRSAPDADGEPPEQRATDAGPAMRTVGVPRLRRSTSRSEDNRNESSP